MRSTIDIAGIKINNLDYDDVLKEIGSMVSDDKKCFIVTVNPEMILNSSVDEDFFSALEKAELRTSDGVGILWAAEYLSKPKYKNPIARFFQLIGSLFLIAFAPKKTRRILKDRVTGSDLLPKVINRSQEKNWRIFLLGASEGVAEKVLKKFTKIYPDSKLVGSHAGTPKKSDEDEICDLIHKAKPNIVFVAYGSPKQEFWIKRNLFKLKTVNVAIGVGGAFDFYAGKVKRAPKWMQKVGLEWLWRFFKEPNRISRIWNATFKYVGYIYRVKNK